MTSSELAGETVETILHVAPEDERARPMFDDLINEYSVRYSDIVGPEELDEELSRYPAQSFLPPDGIFLLLVRDGVTIGGGAFMRHDDQTAELKRIWTHNGYRRQGLGKKVVRALEAEAERVGYRRIFLTTGFRQPEAVALYRSLGYSPLFNPDDNWEELFTLSFEKYLAAGGQAA